MITVLSEKKTEPQVGLYREMQRSRREGRREKGSGNRYIQSEFGRIRYRTLEREGSEHFETSRTLPTDHQRSRSVMFA
jgi:hypothetical protein